MKSTKPSMVFLFIAALFLMFSGCTEQIDNPFRSNDGDSSKELQEGKSEGAGKVMPRNQSNIGQKNSSQEKKAPGMLVLCSYTFADSKRCPDPPYWEVGVYRCHISSPYKCPESPDDCFLVYSYCYGNETKK